MTREDQRIREFARALRMFVGRRYPAGRIYRRERPRCGARCRDGHACQSRAVPDASGFYVANGRCRLHGGLSTGARTPEGKGRVLAALARGRATLRLRRRDQAVPSASI
jgi:hypothetical protein